MSEQDTTEEQTTSADQTAADQTATDQTDANTSATQENEAGQDGAAEQRADSPAPKKTRTRKQSTARKTRTVELTLTVTGTAEGEWQAELTHSGKRVVQGLQVPASAVSKAAAELHQDISEAIETVLYQARQQHEEKLAELEAEVERVRKALAELES